jgi:hypothetical protein
MLIIAEDRGKSKSVLGGCRAIAFILMPCIFVILSDRRERRISLLYCGNEILPLGFALQLRSGQAQDRRRSAPQNDSLRPVWIKCNCPRLMVQERRLGRNSSGVELVKG